MGIDVGIGAPTDHDVEEVRTGRRVAISVTLQRHIVPLYNGLLGHNLEANLL